MIDLACAAAGKGIESASDASNAILGLTRRSFIGRAFIIYQDAQGSAIKVIKLAAAQRPEKGTKAQQTQTQRDRDEESNPGHFAAAFNRSAFATTITDEPDIANAAISGVTIPMIASGTATTL